VRGRLLALAAPAGGVRQDAVAVSHDSSSDGLSPWRFDQFDLSD